MGRNGVINMAIKDKIKKILKWLAIPFIAIGLFVIRRFSLKKDTEIKQDIKDTKQEIKEIKKETTQVTKEFEEKQKELDQAITKTEETVNEILTNKEDRDKAAAKFFK